MSLSRRKMIALIGVGAVFAAGAGAAGFVTTRTPHAALAPWDAAGQYVDPRMRALSYALLAPNPHNRQPWEAELIGDHTVAIWRDPARNLPETDPFDRQLTIGMGCFLELMEMAAAQDGFGVERELFPAGEDGPVAICQFVPGAASPDPLFAHVLTRRSHKEAFDGTLVSADAEKVIAPYGRVITAASDVARLHNIAAEAINIETHTPAAHKESIDLLRIGRSEIEATPDGIDLGGPMMEALALAGLLTREAALDVENPNTKRVTEDMMAVVRTAPAFVVLTTAGNSRIDQTETGGAWIRMNLAATGAGLATRPVSQALQEYPEMAELYSAIHSEFAPEGHTLQMLGLLGYAPATPRTPRWPLETRMRNG